MYPAQRLYFYLLPRSLLFRAPRPSGGAVPRPATHPSCRRLRPSRWVESRRDDAPREAEGSAARWQASTHGTTRGAPPPTRNTEPIHAAKARKRVRGGLDTGAGGREPRPAAPPKSKVK
jgi:hypothetical protein